MANQVAIHTDQPRAGLDPSVSTDVAVFSYYRNAEQHGANLLFRLLRHLEDPDAQIALSQHLADETRHAWLWTERIVRAGGNGVEPRIQFAYREVLQRPARGEEVRLLAALYQQHREQYREEKQAAEALLGIGEWPAAKDVEAAELAAWTSVARVLLNLHETITRN